MADDPLPSPSRRALLGGAVAAACVGCAAPPADTGDGPRTVEGWQIPPSAHLDAARWATLVAAFDALIPDDDGTPGATEARAAWYVAALLGAFDSDPPRIFAGGPYSGRHGGIPGFCAFQPLTRVEELRWRTFLEGSLGLPEREFAGPVEGLAVRLERALDALDDLATLPLTDRRARLLVADEAHVALLYELAVEGTYGDPVYGGNRGGLGWAAIDFEGDRQPVGYTPRQMARPEEG